MDGEGERSYPSTMTLNKLRVPHVPHRYILPPSECPNPIANSSSTLPIVDISSSQDPSLSSHTIDEIRRACKEIGFSQAINHGIPLSVMKDALDAATEFFNLHKEIEEAMQVMALNCYPACSEPELALGMLPHSDYGSITILLQSSQGLQPMDQNNNWLPVQVVEGALIVQSGDQIEVMSNGRYRNVVQRATVSIEKKRLSIASRHGLPLNKKIGPAPKLVDDLHPESDNSITLSLSTSASDALLTFITLRFMYALHSSTHALSLSVTETSSRKKKRNKAGDVDQTATMFLRPTKNRIGRRVLFSPR